MSGRPNFTQEPPKYEVIQGRYAVLIVNLHGVPKAMAYGSTPAAAQDCATIIIHAFEGAVK